MLKGNGALFPDREDLYMYIVKRPDSFGQKVIKGLMQIVVIGTCSSLFVWGGLVYLELQVSKPIVKTVDGVIVEVEVPQENGEVYYPPDPTKWIKENGCRGCSWISVDPNKYREEKVVPPPDLEEMTPADEFVGGFLFLVF